jgi:hypothetical protein
MKAVLLITVVSLAGVGFNYLLSLMLSHFVREHGSILEKLRISAIEELDSLKKRKDLSPAEIARLWSDTMNLVMTAKTESVARRYLERAVSELGAGGPEFRRQAEAIIRDLFNVDPVGRAES